MSGGPRKWRREANQWIRADFTAANLRDSEHHNELFDSCDFARAALDDVEFGGARHVASKFSGRLDGVIFSRWPLPRGKHDLENAMTDVDMTATELVNCEFNELDLLRVRLPHNDKHVIYRPRRRVAEEILRRLPARESLVDLRLLAELDLERSPAGDAFGVVHISELGQDDRERAASVEILRAAQAAVAHM